MNPKIIMFMVTFLPQFVSAGDPHATQKPIFLASCSWSSRCRARSRWSSLPRVLRNAEAHAAIIRAIDWLFAGIFSAFAVRLLLTRNH